jgi:predicted kinase
MQTIHKVPAQRLPMGQNMLIIFGGYLGLEKTTIARELARRISAVYLRIDSIEQAILRSGLASRSPNDTGYHFAYAVAEDR